MEAKTRTKAVVLVDLDETVAEFRKGLCDALTKRGRVEDARRVQDCKEEEVSADLEPIVREIMSEAGFFLNLQPMPGAIKAIQKLAESCEVVFCTSPIKDSLFCAGEKLAWIKKHFGADMARASIIAKDKWRINADFLIDDRPQDTNGRGAQWIQIFFQRPWNLKHCGNSFSLMRRPSIESWLDPALFSLVSL